MATVDSLRNNIIDKLLTISNKEYLSALYQLVDKSAGDESLVTLTGEQIEMLKLSDDDILHDRLISQEELDRQDLEWLKNR